jgi:hypothetical protein
MKDINLNFGAIRDSISRLATNEMLKENKNNTFNVFVENVKKNPTLFKQHIVFKNFEDCKPFKKEMLAERFINENLSILKGLNWFEILKENRETRIKLLENSHVESTGGNKNELFNNIHNLIESVTKPNFTDIEKSQKSYEFLLEYLTRKDEKTSLEENDNPNFKNWEFITKLAVNNFNSRYEHLEESDKEIMKTLLSENNKKINKLKDLKEDTLKNINKLLNLSKDKEELLALENFKKKIIKHESFENGGVDQQIIEYHELNKTLKEKTALI